MERTKLAFLERDCQTILSGFCCGGKKIREIEPNAVILAGSTARVSKRFTRGLFNSGAMEYVDGFPFIPTQRRRKEQYTKLSSKKKSWTNLILINQSG